MSASNALVDGTAVPELDNTATSPPINDSEGHEEQPSADTASAAVARPPRPPPTYRVSPQMQQQIDEQQARVAKNDAAEVNVQQEWLQQASHAMREWYSIHDHNLEKTKRKNRETSRNRAQKEQDAKATNESNITNPWERIAYLCDITPPDPSTAPATTTAVDSHRQQQALLPTVKTDLTRMREVMRMMCRTPIIPDKLKTV